MISLSIEWHSTFWLVFKWLLLHKWLNMVERCHTWYYYCSLCSQRRDFYWVHLKIPNANSVPNFSTCIWLNWTFFVWKYRLSQILFSCHGQSSCVKNGVRVFDRQWCQQQQHHKHVLIFKIHCYYLQLLLLLLLSLFLLSLLLSSLLLCLVPVVIMLVVVIALLLVVAVIIFFWVLL